MTWTRFDRGSAGAVGAIILASAASAAPPPAFQVREGYAVSTVVAPLHNARFITFDEQGTLYVSRPWRGDIIACRDEDGDGEFETRATFVSQYPFVQSVQSFEGWLWFATTASIHRAIDDNGDGVADRVENIISPGSLPAGSGHWWRSLLVTEESIFTSIGDPDNISDQRDSDRQKIFVFDRSRLTGRVFASGIRNTEKILFRPGTRELWGIDHGSDRFGQAYGESAGNQPITDLLPPDELNLYIDGGFYGHPFLVGPRIPRPEYADRPDLVELAASTIPPEWSLPAHWAVNGFTFMDPAINRRTGAFPVDHEGDLFFAAHGSWNSTEPVGYCIARVLFDHGKPFGLLPIVRTLDEDGEAIGRPVDVAQGPDGALYFTSDFPAGGVYRLMWIGKE